MNKVRYRDLFSIVRIANKYDLRPEQLVDAFTEASSEGNSQCGCLEISCRLSSQDYALITITKAGKAIWQASVNLEVITDQDIKDNISEIAVLLKKAEKVIRKLKISELKFGMKSIEVTAEVIEKSPAKLIMTRWGAQASVSNVKIADETGSIKLSLWNNQIEDINIGNEVQITNCYVSKFLDELQLRVARKGMILRKTIVGSEIIVPNS